MLPFSRCEVDLHSESDLSSLSPVPQLLPVNALPFHNVCRMDKGIKVIFPIRWSACQKFIIYDKVRVRVNEGREESREQMEIGILESLLSASREHSTLFRSPGPLCPKSYNSSSPVRANSTQTVVPDEQTSNSQSIFHIYLEDLFPNL